MVTKLKAIADFRKEILEAIAHLGSDSFHCDLMNISPLARVFYRNRTNRTFFIEL
ncbi:MAG: hypothetical protein VKL41_01440 [Snowella sp.]|nr:hypothetical protein [Snowella sp.]